MADTITYANIMLLGRTGAGKSSFINYLIGTDVFKTGTGTPVTQGFDSREYPDVQGIPLRVFDSKGLEVKDYDNIREELIDFVRKCCGSENVFEWIHSIFYCVNVECRRLEPEEVNFIKSLSGEIAQTVHVILTHCKIGPEGLDEAAQNMANHVKSQLSDKKIHIFCVNSVETRTRLGVYPVFGRNELLEQIFELLWSDISHKVAKEYASELHEGLMQLYRELSSVCDKIIRRISAAKLLSDLLSERDDMMSALDEAFEGTEERIYQIEAELSSKFHRRIEKLVSFCNGYSDSMGYQIELYDPTDFAGGLFDIDVDECVAKTRLGRIMEEMDDLDMDSSLLGAIAGAAKMITVLLRLKSLFKEVLGEVKYEFRRSIPDEEEIERSIYDALMKGLQTDF